MMDGWKNVTLLRCKPGCTSLPAAPFYTRVDEAKATGLKVSRGKKNDDLSPGMEREGDGWDR